jgi:hypothetical protein
VLNIYVISPRLIDMRLQTSMAYSEAANLSPQKREQWIGEKILNALRLHPEGLSIADVAKESNFGRDTVEKHLQRLELQNEIFRLDLGSTKMYLPNHRLHHFYTRSFAAGANRKVWISLLRNQHGFYLILSESRRVNNGWETKGSILVPVAEVGKFSEFVMTSVTEIEDRIPYLNSDSSNLNSSSANGENPSNRI